MGQNNVYLGRDLDRLELDLDSERRLNLECCFRLLVKDVCVLFDDLEYNLPESDLDLERDLESDLNFDLGTITM